MGRTMGAISRETDIKLTACIKQIKKALKAGYTLGAMGAQVKTRNINVREILREYQLNTRLSGLLMTFDFSKRVTLERVAQERAAYCRRLQEASQISESKREPRVEKPERLLGVVAGGYFLDDWHLLGHDGLELIWRRTDGRAVVTVHSLEPQVYSYEDRWQPDGTHYVKRTWLQGDFKGGQLTQRAMERILEEARAELLARLPDCVPQTHAAALAQFKYLMR